MPACRLGPLLAALLLGLLLGLPPVTGEWGGERLGAQRGRTGSAGTERGRSLEPL